MVTQTAVVVAGTEPQTVGLPYEFPGRSRRTAKGI